MTLSRLVFGLRLLALLLLLAGHGIALVCLSAASKLPRSPLENLLADALPPILVGLLTILLFCCPATTVGWLGRWFCAVLGLSVAYLATAPLVPFDAWHLRETLLWQTATIFVVCTLACSLARLTFRSSSAQANSDQFSLSGLLALMFICACLVWGAMSVRGFSTGAAVLKDAPASSMHLHEMLVRPALGISLGMACLLAAWTAVSRRAWLKVPSTAVAIVVLGWGTSWALRREGDAALVISWLLLVAAVVAFDLLVLRAIAFFERRAVASSRLSASSPSRSAASAGDRQLGVVS